MKYYAIFDNKGNRITTYVEGLHENIPAEAIEITKEDQQLYATNEYIRGAGGKPAKKLPHVPTTEEKLIQYKEQRDALLSATDIPYLRPDYTIKGQRLTSYQRTELEVYCQALRDAPEQSYPEFPAKPSWL